MTESDQPRAPRSSIDDELAVAVSAYVRAHLADPTSDQLTALLDRVRVVLEYLLGAHLEGIGFKGWCDGVFPATLAAPVTASADGAEGEMSFRGSALWGKSSNGPFWLEPFLASVRVSFSSGALESYGLYMGNAETGLSTLADGERIRRESWHFPEEWAYIFAGPVSPSD